LIDSLARLAEESPSPPVVLASSHPTIFMAGADLAEIAALDEHSCVPYSDLGRSLAAALASHTGPVVASVHGSCSGGGFDLVMACDAVVASPNATFSHPGVRRGLVTGWGGTTGLEAAMGPSTTRRALLEGATIDAPTLAGLGVAIEVTDDPRTRARETARRIGRLHPSRLSLWRLLRGPTFVDRFRAFVVEKS
jgi:enoyl-CoA hydratase